MTLRIVPRLMEMGPFSGQNLKNAQKNLIGKSCKFRRRKGPEKYAKMYQNGAESRRQTFRKSMPKKIVKLDVKKGRS